MSYSAQPVPESPDNNALRELRDEVKDLNRTIKQANIDTERYTRVLVFLGIVQFMVAYWQLFISTYEIKDKAISGFIAIGFIGILFWTVKKIGLHKK